MRRQRKRENYNKIIYYQRQLSTKMLGVLYHHIYVINVHDICPWCMSLHFMYMVYVITLHIYGVCHHITYGICHHITCIWCVSSHYMYMVCVITLHVYGICHHITYGICHHITCTWINYKNSFVYWAYTSCDLLSIIILTTCSFFLLTFTR